MKYIYIFIIFAFSFTHINGMKHLLSQDKKIQIRRTELKPSFSKTAMYTNYLKEAFLEKNKDIFHILSDAIVKDFDSIPAINSLLSSFACTNKFYNLYFNNSQRTLKWIKELSLRFNYSNMHFAQILPTLESKRRYALQYAFYAPFDSVYCDTLKKQGFDLEFTQESIDENKTYLMIATSVNNNDHLEKTDWLITNGADVSQLAYTVSNISVVMHYAIHSTNITLVEKIFSHPKFNVNILDKNNNNLLKRLMRVVERQYRFFKGYTEQQYVIAYQIMDLLAQKHISSSR